jgi:hypothetical protein
MGANDCWERFQAKDIKEAKAELNRIIDESRYTDGHSYSGCIGMVSGIKFCGVRTNEAMAEKFIEKHREKWGPALLVRVIDSDLWIAGAVCAS